MEHIARGNGGMLSARLTASIPFALSRASVIAPHELQAQENAHDAKDRRVAQLVPPAPGYLRGRHETRNFL